MTTKEGIKAELDAIQSANGGLIRAGDVVDFARAHPESALHGQFTWDVQKAARKRWLDEARQIIRVYVNVLKEETPEVRAFVSLESDRLTGGGYRTMAEVLTNPERRSELLRQAVKELRAWQQRYDELHELASLFEQIDKLEPPSEEAGEAA